VLFRGQTRQLAFLHLLRVTGGIVRGSTASVTVRSRSRSTAPAYAESLPLRFQLQAGTVYVCEAASQPYVLLLSSHASAEQRGCFCACARAAMPPARFSAAASARQRMVSSRELVISRPYRPAAW